MHIESTLLRWPFLGWVRRRRCRQALPSSLRTRVESLQAQNQLGSRGLREPLTLARFVALDLETTGARMDLDRIICIGAIAVRAQTIPHQEAFERFVRQPQASSVDNILIHQIGGQQQLGGEDPAVVLLECLEFLNSSVVVAFRAEFDSTILRREAAQLLGVRVANRFVDLAVLLPALFPATQNDTLEDWMMHFGLRVATRHQALADAYAHAALLLIVLRRASQVGLHTIDDLIGIEKAQRWLGLRR